MTPGKTALFLSGLVNNNIPSSFACKAIVSTYNPRGDNHTDMETYRQGRIYCHQV